MLSTMTAKPVDANNHHKISTLGERVLGGGQVSRDEALWLFNLESSADILDLLSWSNRIREQFKGNKIHLCSIVNAKAGACSENCSFCAQSSFYQTGSPKYGFVDPETVAEVMVTETAPPPAEKQPDDSQAKAAEAKAAAEPKPKSKKKVR